MDGDGFPPSGGAVMTQQNGEEQPLPSQGNRREAMLAALRCVSLRLQLATAEADSIGVTLKQNLISEDEAYWWFWDELMPLLDFVERVQ
jgi:hypothetical protein